MLIPTPTKFHKRGFPNSNFSYIYALNDGYLLQPYEECQKKRVLVKDVQIVLDSLRSTPLNENSRRKKLTCNFPASATKAFPKTGDSTYWLSATKNLSHLSPKRFEKCQKPQALFWTNCHCAWEWARECQNCYKWKSCPVLLLSLTGQTRIGLNGHPIKKE